MKTGTERSAKTAWIVTAVCLAAAYFATRLVNLTALPMFCDETTYLLWAQRGLEEPALRYMSLTDGKQPFFIWLLMLALPRFDDPLVAGRVVSVVAGFVGLVGVATLAGVVLRDRRAALWAALLHVVSPFFLFYDRMAMYESLTACIIAWALVLIVSLARIPRVDTALTLGLVGGLGCLTKSSAFFALPYLAISVLLFDRGQWRAKRILVWLGTGLLATGLAVSIYSLLRLTPWFDYIAIKNTFFVTPFDEWSRAPFASVHANLPRLSRWLVINLTPPVTALAALGLVWGPATWRARLFLLGVFAGPFVFMVFFGKAIFPRYLLFMSVPLIVLAAAALKALIERMRRRGVRLAVLALLCAYPLYFSAMLLIAPDRAPLAWDDRKNHFLGQYNAAGLNELVDELRARSAERPVTVAARGSGVYVTGLEVRAAGLPNIAVHEGSLTGLPLGSDHYVVTHDTELSAHFSPAIAARLERVWAYPCRWRNAILALYRLRE